MRCGGRATIAQVGLTASLGLILGFAAITAALLSMVSLGCSASPTVERQGYPPSTASSTLRPPSTQSTSAISATATSATTTSDNLPTTTPTSMSTLTTSQTAGVKVVNIIDGDTIAVATEGGKEEVRLIGIDTPESGEDFAQQATDALEKLVGRATVRLETDMETRDQYDRLLAYVWVSEVMANEELLRQGLATIYTVPPNVRYVERFRAAQDEAQAAELGFWGEPANSPLQIVAVEYNAPGDDSLNLNEEYITFKVLVSGALVGYSVEDETGHRYQFPDIVFERGRLFKLHSGEGQDTETDLYWGAFGAAIWNNDGDTVKVLDPQDQIVESYDY